METDSNPILILSPRAVILISGGMDSATTLAHVIRRGFEAYALTFDYGQRQVVEIQAAKRIAGQMGVRRHEFVTLNLSLFNKSALTGEPMVPKRGGGIDAGGEIPVTYVPARNAILLSVALGWAETIGARHVFIGANAVDYSGYPDCRPEFLAAFQNMADLATKQGVEGRKIAIEAPLIGLSKAEIIKLGLELGVDYSLTISCYDPDAEGRACGVCDACALRRRGFAEAGMKDPAAL